MGWYGCCGVGFLLSLICSNMLYVNIVCLYITSYLLFHGILCFCLGLAVGLGGCV